MRFGATRPSAARPVVRRCFSVRLELTGDPILVGEELLQFGRDLRVAGEELPDLRGMAQIHLLQVGRDRLVERVDRRI